MIFLGKLYIQFLGYKVFLIKLNYMITLANVTQNVIFSQRQLNLIV